ncbi:MAG: SPFH domain-containing protein, partial [Candidatus Atribacteria bacterium]|nr:SPFH domain-containing protein [Candidatus Atribacteria bacterium]
MGLGKFIKGQLIDIIEFTTDDKSILAHKFDPANKQIMMGAQLTVRPGQKAVFINEGEIADIFDEGRYELSTSNMPLLTTLKAWKYGFESPFKVDIYF